MERMLLREFLYVDTAKVRGLLAQLDDGIVEQEVQKRANKKVTTGGFKGVASHAHDWGEEISLTKSVGDAIFPTLENALESTGDLTDISEEVQDSDYWLSETFRESFPAGSIIRVTGPGHLFDSRFVAQTFADFAAAAVGLQNLGVVEAETTGISSPVPPKAKQAGSIRKRQVKKVHRATVSHWSEEALETRIPDDFAMPDGVDSATLHGIIQISRGVFHPGLYLNLSPTLDEAGCVIQARLEEGRSFLDSEPDVLFSRYGVGKQDWTIMGIVGHHAAAYVKAVDLDGNFTAADGSVQRARFSEYVNKFMQHLGGLGFVDLAQEPAVSLIPIAVYRTLNTRLISPSA